MCSAAPMCACRRLLPHLARISPSHACPDTSAPQHTEQEHAAAAKGHQSKARPGGPPRRPAQAAAETRSTSASPLTFSRVMRSMWITHFLRYTCRHAGAAQQAHKRGMPTGRAARQARSSMSHAAPAAPRGSKQHGRLQCCSETANNVTTYSSISSRQWQQRQAQAPSSNFELGRRPHAGPQPPHLHDLALAALVGAAHDGHLVVLADGHRAHLRRQRGVAVKRAQQRRAAAAPPRIPAACCPPPPGPAPLARAATEPALAAGPGAQGAPACHPALTPYLLRSSVDSGALISFRRALEGAVKCACRAGGRGGSEPPGAAVAAGPAERSIRACIPLRCPSSAAPAAMARCLPSCTSCGCWSRRWRTSWCPFAPSRSHRATKEAGAGGEPAPCPCHRPQHAGLGASPPRANWLHSAVLHR